MASQETSKHACAVFSPLVCCLYAPGLPVWARFLFSKVIGKTKQVEAFCQGQCEEIQPTHDEVNQCHGSQNVCLALLKQLTKGQTKNGTPIKCSTFSAVFFLKFLYLKCLKCHMQPF